MSDPVTGRRVEWAGQILNNGEYAQAEDGTWYAMTPNGMLANLAKHYVRENDDLTITVSPSILVTGHDGSWHGFLFEGVWTEC